MSMAEKPIPVRSINHIPNIPFGVDNVQLTSQQAVSVRFFTVLHELRPNINKVSIAPSLYRRLVGPGVRDFVSKMGIQIEESNLKRGVIYQHTRWANDHKKRELYEKMLEDEPKRKIFELMLEFGFEEAVVGKRYFEENISVAQLADEMGITRVKAQRLSSVFLYWLGRKSTDKDIIHHHNRLMGQIKKIFVMV